MSFNHSACKTVLNLMDVVYLRLDTDSSQV